MRKSLRFFALPIVSLLFLCVDAVGCSCAPERIRPGVTVEQIRNEKYKYFSSEFKGAAFIGKIVKRELVIVNWIAKTEAGEPADSTRYRYTIRVKEYWFGVKSPTIIVYGAPAEPLVLSNGDSYGWSSCGFKLKIGQIYFFTPAIHENNL